MRVSKLLGERFKNAPSDCLIDSHKLMVRGGYMKYMANGIYSLFMPTKRITRKNVWTGRNFLLFGLFLCKWLRFYENLRIFAITNHHLKKDNNRSYGKGF